MTRACLGICVSVLGEASEAAMAAAQPFSLFMLGLVRNQERDEAKMAATQNSPPLDLLGEI